MTPLEQLDEALEYLERFVDSVLNTCDQNLTVGTAKEKLKGIREYSSILAGDVVVVPREPTAEMRGAGLARLDVSYMDFDGRIKNIADIYRAMIAAAPELAKEGTREASAEIIEADNKAGGV